MDRNIRVALYIGLGITVWFASGLLEKPEESAETAVVEQALSVEVSQFTPQNYRPKLMLEATTKAYRAVDLRAEVSGLLLKRPLPEGSQVAEDAAVCQLDKDTRPEALSQARAELAVAELDYQGAQRLQQAGIESELAIARAYAALQRARTVERRAQIELANSNIVAPFAGVVERYWADEGDFLQPGESCATLLQLNPLKIVAFATEQELAGIQLGAAVNVTLLSGEILSGEVTYVARSDQGSTASYRVEVTADNDQLQAAGLSASLALSLAEVQAVKIPAHLVVLDRSGDLVVRGLDSSNRRVIEYPVVQIDEALDGIWVTGINQSVRLITVGQNYVAVGDQVEAMTSSEQGDR
ncbi:MAG: efflux RND transporter periplasmic adaptor subunit [Porticoccaceae bacterium]